MWLIKSKFAPQLHLQDSPVGPKSKATMLNPNYTPQIQKGCLFIERKYYSPVCPFLFTFPTDKMHSSSYEKYATKKKFPQQQKLFVVV